MDAVSARAVEQVAKSFIAAGGSVVLVSHDTGQTGRIAGQVLVLHAGQLTAGPAPNILSYQEDP